MSWKKEITRKIFCKVQKSDKVFVRPGQSVEIVFYNEISILSSKYVIILSSIMTQS